MSNSAPTTTPTTIAGVDATLIRPGGLSYLEIPAVDAHESATFYQNVLGWHISANDSGDPRFGDPANLLIGRWDTTRPSAPVPGLLPYFYVADIEAAIAQVIPSAGKVVEPPQPESNLTVAKIQDPAGNIIGLWQVSPR
jgi:predicted enzyme related to lactoylglutathione lyase